VARSPEVAELLKLSSADLMQLGLADDVIAEGQDALDAAVARALSEATAGERESRFDAATARWLT
jgi:acetyl-CoA carboxylase alpha subunit